MADLTDEFVTIRVITYAIYVGEIRVWPERGNWGVLCRDLEKAREMARSYAAKHPGQASLKAVVWAPDIEPHQFGRSALVGITF